MSSKWTKATIADVLELVIDHRGKTPKKLGFDDFHCSGYQVLSAKHVKTSGLTSLDSIRYANESMYNKWMKVPLQKGDVILTSEAPMGETYYIDGSVQYLLGQRVFGLRPKQELIEPLYLLSWLSSQVGQSKLKERATGSTVQGIKQSELLKVEIELPPLFVQRAIAANQSSISEKIQLNSKINQTLEQMAQAIFKSWFVDFEPVKAKIAALEAGGNEDDALLAAMQAIAGSALFATDAADTDAQTQLARLQTEHPEQYATLRATAELFPSAMQESELGEIPEGWEAKRVGKYLDTISKTYPLKKVKEVVFLNTGDIKEGRFLHANKSLTEGLPGQAKKSIKKHDILYSEIRPQNKRYAYVDFEADDYVVSTKLMVLRSSGEVDSRFLYFLLTQKDSIDYLQMMAESRSGTFPQITFDVLEKINFLGPVDNKLLNYFAKFFLLPFMNNSFEIVQQNKNLEELRDTLLPKLLSGEIDVSALADNTEANA